MTMTRNKASSVHEAARTLLEVFAAEETFQRVNFADMSLGSFLRAYAGPPAPAELDSRSSIREDAVIREISRILGEQQGIVRIIDACCGLANLPRRVIKALGNDISRVEYIAVEREAICVELMRAQEEEFRGFASFTPVLRDVRDLAGSEFSGAHLVVLNNVIHEIAPRYFPDIFAAINALLSRQGRICVIDMEALPADAPEAIAINWTASEFTEILKSAGFQPERSVHQKSVAVYQVHMRAVGSIHKRSMLLAIYSQVISKLDAAIRARRQADVAVASKAGDHADWLVKTGTVARLADEALALEKLIEAEGDKSVEVRTDAH